MKYKNYALLFLILICLQLLGTTVLQAQNIILTTTDTKLSINAQGYFSSVNVGGKELLHAGQYPLVAVAVGVDNQKTVHGIPADRAGNDDRILISLD